MADYEDSKSSLGGIFLEGEIEGVFGRLEPLLTPQQLVDRYLDGIPLQSAVPDPITKKPVPITPDKLKDYIIGAVSRAEAELGIVIMPTKIREKKAYLRQDWKSWGYFRLDNKPISSLDRMTISFADSTEAFVFPMNWIEAANLVWGQVSVIPATNNGMMAPTGGSVEGSLLYLQFFNTRWVTALIQFEYTAGFPNGNLPRLVNDYIGVLAAMGVLSRLGATNARTNSSSLSIDGVSQNVSGPGNQLYKPRLDDLKEEKGLLEKAIRKIFRRIAVTSV